MSDVDKKKLTASPPAAGHPPPMMIGASMVGGCPTLGGTGPTLVFNFYPACGIEKAAGSGKEEHKKEEKEGKKGNDKPPLLVQGDPTWHQPRQRVKKGEQLKPDPCVIM